MAGYSSRQSSYTTGDVVQAADTNDEFTVILAAYDAARGHAHDGTAGEGPVLTATGALNAGSITSGFGNIDNGTSNIISGGIWTVDVDGTDIGAAGSINFGAATNDAAVYWDGTNFVLDTTSKFDISVSGTSIATWDGSALNLASGNLTVASGTLSASGTVTGSNISGTNTGDEAVASTTVSGTVELLTDAEAITGTDTTRSMTAAASRAALVDGNDTTMGKFNLKDTGEITNAIGSIGGGTQDIAIPSGNSVTATVDPSTPTFTFSDPTASPILCAFALTLTNGASQTINWPTSVDWAGGSAPILTAAGVDVLIFFTVDGGTIWHGMVSSTDSS